MRRIVLLSALIGALCAASAHAANPSDLFRWSVSPDTAVAAADGDTAIFTFRLSIADGYYVYAERTGVSLAAHKGVGNAKVLASPPHLEYDRFEEHEVPKYRGEAVYRLSLVPAGVTVGRIVPLAIDLHTQGCSSTQCYFPLKEDVTVYLKVGAGSASAGPAITGGAGQLADYSSPAAGGQPGTSRSGGALDVDRFLGEGSILLALGIMFLGGILTSFTPCVYPLIPITVSLFGAAGVSAARGLLLSSVFVLGMAVMYSALGVTAAATGAVFGSVMTNPIVISLVALVLLAFAASMFGAFEIQLPSSLQLRLARVGGAGVGGSFAAGLVAGIVAAPCTGPVLGAALTYVATTGDLVIGFATMFAFALGMGLLFIVIGTFSARVVPRSGPWLEKINSVFGIAMVVAALWFLKDVVTPLREIARPGSTALIVSAAFVVVGLIAGAVHLRFAAGFDRDGNPEPRPSVMERGRKAVGILFVVFGAFAGLSGLVATPAHGTAGGPDWIRSESAGLAIARREGKPVLIDAYADWCTACKELDADTYSDPRVIDRLRSFVPVKLDFTNRTPETDSLVARYGIVGLPTVIVLDRDGKELRDRRITGFVPPNVFLAHLAGID